MARKKNEPGVTTLEVDGELMELDFDSLTLGEVSEMEMQFQQPLGRIQEMGEQGFMSVLTFLVYIVRRRKKDTTTLDDVGKVKLVSVKQPKRPTKASSKAAPAGSGDQS